KSKRRFAGALEPFTLVNAQLVERHSGTYRLDSVEILRTFAPIREDLPRIARALYVIELARELVRDREPHPELYEHVIGYLEALEANTVGATSLLAFELTAVAIAGFMPRFDRCTLCGQSVGEAPLFDPDHGGAVCALC